MSWLALLAPIQVLGCPADEAARVRRLIALELEGAPVTAVELRCAEAIRLEVQVGDRRDARGFPKDALTRPGGARLIAVAAADLADDLRAAPPPAASSPPPDIVSSPPVTRLRGYPGLMVRTRFADLQPGIGLAVQAERDGLFIELSTAAFLPVETEHALGTTSGTRLDGGLGIGFLNPAGVLTTGGLIGWRAGYAAFEGVAAGGATRAVAGLFGGPFLGSRVDLDAGPLRIGFAIDLGWSIWTVTGRVDGAPAEAEEGLWLAFATRVGFDL